MFCVANVSIDLPEHHFSSIPKVRRVFLDGEIHLTIPVLASVCSSCADRPS